MLWCISRKPLFSLHVFMKKCDTKIWSFERLLDGVLPYTHNVHNKLTKRFSTEISKKSQKKFFFHINQCNNEVQCLWWHHRHGHWEGQFVCTKNMKTPKHEFKKCNKTEVRWITNKGVIAWALVTYFYYTHPFKILGCIMYICTYVYVVAC